MNPNKIYSGFCQNQILTWYGVFPVFQRRMFRKDDLGGDTGTVEQGIVVKCNLWDNARNKYYC